VKGDDTLGGETIAVIGDLPFLATGKLTTFWLGRSAGISESIKPNKEAQGWGPLP